MITHFMMMQLLVPQNAAIFYGGLFEFVTFDIIPTDDIYDKLFDEGWRTEPYSPEADGIGYGTRLLFSNLGSVFWIIIFLAILQSVFLTVSKFAHKDGRVKKFVDNRRASFFPGGLTDFAHEVYLIMSFGVCINFSELEFKRVSTSFHNIFVIVCAVALVSGPIAIAINVGRQWQTQET